VKAQELWARYIFQVPAPNTPNRLDKTCNRRVRMEKLVFGTVVWAWSWAR